MGQPYINPNYFAQYPQYFQPQPQPQTNPYMQRMEQLQQYQQALQQQPQMQTVQYQPLGKVVDGIDTVKATDIPMDGNVYYFPTADGSAVFGKQWTMDGKTRILTFKPILESEPNNLSSEEEKLKFDTFNAILEGIQEDVKTLNEKVDKLSKPTRAKKEVSEDE